MLHTVKTTCAISALLVSFAATAHAANVVSDPYASYIDCSKGQAQSSGNSGCTVRGQQVTVSALSQMMATANANVANIKANTAISNYAYNLRPYFGNERGNVQYERGTELGIDGKNREVKQLVFLVDPRPKGKDGLDAPGGNVNDREGRGVSTKDRRDANGRLIKDGRDSTGDRRDANGRLIKDGRNQPTGESSSTTAYSDGVARVYKIELSDAAAAQIEKFNPRKLERDEGVSTSSQASSDRQATETWDDDDANGYVREVVIPLEYASDDEIKAEEAKLATAAPAASTSAVALAAPANSNQSGESVALKVMILKDSRSSDETTATLRIYSATTAEVIYAAPVRTDALVAYRIREAAPTRNLAQYGTSAAPGENVRDQSYSGSTNTSLGSGESSGNQSEPMDKDNPDSGKGGAGT